MHQVATDIRAIRELLRDPKRWTRLATARDRNGDPVPALSQFAVSWDLAGAMHWICNDGERELAVIAALKAVLPPATTYVAWQDAPGRTHDEVLELLERARKGR